ncbi:hypothetical protein FB451DRAFT_1529686 [Mycena latifolia]|nr:hypothetical protein FB451DRAFT_1529686 [Mycena latifolia]
MPDIPDIPAASMFSQLENLQLASTTVTPLFRFFSFIRDAPLVSTTLTVPGSATESEMHDLHRGLAAAASHTSLASLALRGSYNRGSVSEHNGRLMRSSTLRILCCFANIRSLRIGVPLAFELDDATVLDIARAWPRLEDLELNSFCTSIKSQVTIQGLCSFAQHCPRLAILRMSFGASTVPNHETNLLSTIFRSLQSTNDDLTPSTQANVAYSRRWAEVESMILL